MIVVYIRNDGGEHEILLRGHANYADKGHDIVCASATIISYALARELSIQESKGHCVVGNCIMDEGNIRITAEFAKKNRECQTAFNMAAGAFEMLSNTYKDYIRISRESVL